MALTAKQIQQLNATYSRVGGPTAGDMVNIRYAVTQGYTPPQVAATTNYTTATSNPYSYIAPNNGGMNPLATTPARITPQVAPATSTAKPALPLLQNAWTATSATPVAVAPTATAPKVNTGGTAAPVATGTANAANVVRNPDGSISVPTTNPLDQWKDQLGFIEAAKEIIRKKQGYNKDLEEQKAYWRKLIRDTSPFGGERRIIDPNSVYINPDVSGGEFTDADLRLLSPEDQASIRASRYAAGQAHLQGLDEEEKYRESAPNDILTTLKEYYEQKVTEADNAAKNANDAEAAKLDREKFEWQKKSTAIDQAIAASKAGGTSGTPADFNKDIILGQNDLKKGSTWGQVWNRLYAKYRSGDVNQDRALQETLDNLLDKSIWYNTNAFSNFMGASKDPAAMAAMAAYQNSGTTTQ